MIGAIIDLTARSRIRALAARMHRAGIASVFSIGGGAASVDEGALSAEQRAEVASILEATSDESVDDVATAARVAATVSRYVKPSCPTCRGGGVVRRVGADDICACVDRRWQAALDSQALVEGLRSPGRAFGARVEGTRTADREERITQAREALARARAEATAACADVDARIMASEAHLVGYRAERERLDAGARLAGACAEAVAAAQSRVEEVALRIGRVVESIIEGRLTASAAEMHEAVDAICVAASEAGARRVDRDGAEEAARQLAALDASCAPAVGEVERWRAERARIARHHQPKVDRAERRLRRLLYVAGGTPAAVGASVDEGRGS